MGFISENKTYIFGTFVFVMICMYFILDYFIRYTMHDELKKIKSKQHKKKGQKNITVTDSDKEYTENEPNKTMTNEGDSYIDPMET